MAILQAEGILDLVRDTLRDLGKPNYTDLASPLQNHVAMDELLKEERLMIESGYGIQWNILTTYNNNARNVGLAETDNLNIMDGMVQANTVWRNTQTGYSIIHQAMSMNREPARIVDYVKQQRDMALGALAELQETNVWGAPSVSDTKTPLGIPYWITKNATKGFNGGILSGYSDCAGLSPTTYSAWNNWTAPYTAVSRDDFIRQAREAAVKTNFKPVIKNPSPKRSDSHGYYTNYAVVQPLEESLESQNDNLGKDIASMDGETMFRRVPVKYVAKLDVDTTNPFYGIHWGWFYMAILRGEWMRETEIPYTPGQHNVSSHFIDCTWNLLCKNRRANFVLSNGTTYPS